MERKDNNILIEEALCFNLYSASRAMTQVYRPYLQKLGLTYPQFLVMLLLWQVKNDQFMTVKDLGDRLYLDSGTLTPMIKRLESMQLIKKTRSLADERSVHISLTAKGTQLKKEAKSIPTKMFCQLNLSPERFVEIRDGVKEVLKNLQSVLHD